MSAVAAVAAISNEPRRKESRTEDVDNRASWLGLSVSARRAVLIPKVTRRPSVFTLCLLKYASDTVAEVEMKRLSKPLTC